MIFFVFLSSENGSCELYIGTSNGNVSPCDDYFTAGVDYVYIPHSRRSGNQKKLRDAVEELTVLNLLPARCKEPFSRGLCYHLYLPCGTNGTYHVPRYICPDVCRYVSETLCPAEWEQAKFVVANQVHPVFRNDPGLQIPNCSDTDSLINFLNLSENCCSNAGIIVPSTYVTLAIIWNVATRLTEHSVCIFMIILVTERNNTGSMKNIFQVTLLYMSVT